MSGMISQPTQVQLSAYSEKGKSTALVASATLQLALFSARAFNRSGSAMDVGIVRKFASESLSLFKYTAIGTVYTRVTLPTAATVIIDAATNNAFLIGSKSKSGLIGLALSTASASGVYAVTYWNGSAWTALTTIETPSDYTATGDKYMVFLPPNDWARGGAASLESTHYYIRVQSTTAVATPLQATSIWAGQVLEFIENVADNSGVSIEFENQHPLILQAGEGLMPYFGTANAGNGVRIAYTTV